MIMRSWSGHATAAGAESYVAHFRDILLPKLQSLLLGAPAAHARGR
jgi:hypothetical protein